MAFFKQTFRPGLSTPFLTCGYVKRSRNDSGGAKYANFHSVDQLLTLLTFSPRRRWREGRLRSWSKTSRRGEGTRSEVQLRTFRIHESLHIYRYIGAFYFWSETTAACMSNNRTLCLYSNKNPDIQGEIDLSVLTVHCSWPSRCSLVRKQTCRLLL